MENRITELEISNFKSIKNIKMDCRRINVLIGKPNVGKSNVLEALSLFCDPDLYSPKRFLEECIRYEKLSNLFYDQDRKNQILVKSNLGFASLRFNMNHLNSYDFLVTDRVNYWEDWKNLEGNGNIVALVRESLISFEHSSNPGIRQYYLTLGDNQNLQSHYRSPNAGNSIVKRYHFKSLTEHRNHFPVFLRPPFGDNLFTILETNPDLWNDCAEYFNNYGLDLLLDTEDEKIQVQKKIGRRVTKVPYSLAADTLQRFIFHIAAIESNKNSIMIFEEPESHSYPPYIKRLGEKIIEDTGNQYFIATHSPYLLSPFLQQCPPEDIAIFIADYENHETKVRALTDEEIENILETGIDLFFNMSAFQE